MKKILYTLGLLFFANVSLFAQNVPHDGVLDSTFGTNGSTILPPFSLPLSMAILPSDQIVALYAYNDTMHIGRRGLIKFLKNGKVDSSFGINGVSNLDTGYIVPLYAGGVAADSNNKIISVVGGYDTSAPTDTGFLISRYLPNGKFDTTFNHIGKAKVIFPGLSSIPYFVVIQPDGKYLIVGEYAGVNTNTQIMMARLNVNGSLDTGFCGCGTGKIILNFTKSISSTSAIVQPNGKILISALINYSSAYIFGYLPNGMADSSFGQNGAAVLDKRNNIWALHSLPDGKFLAAGDGRTNPGSDCFFLARFKNDGIPDSSFANNGFANTYVNTERSQGASFIAVQTDGKIILHGSTGSTSPQNALVRYYANGSIDSSFAVNGISLQQISDSFTFFIPVGLGLQSGGKIVNIGYVDDGSYEQQYVSRFTAHPYKTGVPTINEHASYFSVYPNPSSGTFTLSASRFSGKAVIQVTNISGRVIYSFAHDFNVAPNALIHAEQFPAGIYFLKVLAADGTSHVLKLVKN